MADDYDQAQRLRVGKGEQIRAIVQGRDDHDVYMKGLGYENTYRKDKLHKSAADFLLEDILRGTTDEPVPYLARTYRAAWQIERAAYAQMSECLDGHPAWDWMSRIRGIGPTLGAKILSRLDIDLARNASSFWAYCGLSTVPGQRWECPKCGRVGIYSMEKTVTGVHKPKGAPPNSKKTCPALWVRTPDPEGTIRAAMPAAVKGQKRPYDAFAKKTLFLAATSWLKAGNKSFYNQVYRDKMVYYERERPGWDKGRMHFSSLRAAEKLFLSHLYEAWCLSIGRDPEATYVETILGHTGIVSCVDVLDWEASKAA